jgi:diguanylate cyclase (GGDEF)-like protein
VSTISPAAADQARRLAPFAGGALLPYALLTIPPTHWSNGQLVLSAVLTVALGFAAVFVPWRRLPSWTHVLPGLGYVGALALLRNAGAGTSAGVGAVVLLPVFWLALYGSRAQLAVLLAAVLAFFVLPALVVGAPNYPLSGIRGGILFTAVSSIVGVTVQRLVGRIRAQSRERDMLLADLADLAHTDALTGLPNRRAWTAALERAVVVAEASGDALTVAMLDVDDFKAFNDSRGHHEGDALLADSAAGWRERLRPVDVIARLGGDEFAILLPGCDAGAAQLVLERMLAGTPERATCSVGYTEWDRRRPAAALLRAADNALYEAKRRGRAALVGTA